MLSSLAFVSLVLCYALVVGFSVCKGLRFGTLAGALAVAVSVSCAAEPARGASPAGERDEETVPASPPSRTTAQRKSTSLTRTEYARMQDTWAPAREQLVKHEILGAGIKNPRVLDAIRVTPRHEFIPIITTKIGDGYQGWAEHAPFDKIIVTCSPEDIPQPLVDQLKEGGRLIVPLGERYQQSMCLFCMTDGKLTKQQLDSTLFVPMTGQADAEREVQADPGKPVVINGDFEEVSGKQPKGWYYMRQATIENDASHGNHYQVRLTVLDQRLP